MMCIVARGNIVAEHNAALGRPGDRKFGWPGYPGGVFKYFGNLFGVIASHANIPDIGESEFHAPSLKTAHPTPRQ